MFRNFICLALLVWSLDSVAEGGVEEILNFHQLSDNIGTAGQPTKAQFAYISAANYSTVVNLAMHNSDNALPDEGSIVSSLGMTYIHIPVPWDAPSAAHVKQFVGLMASLEGEKVFVHCAANYRASAFTHRYLTLKKGIASAQATSPLLQQWRPEMDDAWQAILKLQAHDIE